jgi:bifunctional UDP-N-acetylglucosamine pyrophosphorylase/glucosamine-1-phosphate N-acetyltransferase
MNRLAVVLLAAGEGKRMKSALAKVLHPICGRPMVRYPAAVARALRPERAVVVVGRQREKVTAALDAAFGRGKFRYAVQAEQLGTGHAVACAKAALKGFSGTVVILYGDTPRLTAALVKDFLARHRRARADLSAMTAVLDDPAGYGRIVRDAEGGFLRIVEKRDCTPEELAIREGNLGIYAVDAKLLFASLAELDDANDQGELYLTDVAAIARGKGFRVQALPIADPSQVAGINDRLELAEVERRMRRAKIEDLARAGVSFADPEATYVDPEVVVGRDTVIGPGVGLYGSTRVGQGCRVETGARITDCRIGDGVTVRAYSVLSESRVRAGAAVGPFAHVRQGTTIGPKADLGNFVETVRSTIGEGTLAKHLTYLGDAAIGKEVNVGAGTITCNYDGRRKSRTSVGDHAFIGSDSQLVAPVRVGKGAYVGSGSTITRDVPPGALAVARGRQVVRKGWVKSRAGKDETR